MDTPTRMALVKDALAALTPIRIRKLFGTEAYFHGERMFAVLGRDALVLRLPPPLRTEALAASTARPYLSERLAITQGWMEIPYTDELARLTQLAQAAHLAAGRGRSPAKRKFRRAARRKAVNGPR
jgi:TfoX/Sxy family transcriptional regulator of competence genes